MGMDQPTSRVVANNYPAHMIILIDAVAGHHEAGSFQLPVPLWYRWALRFNYNLYAYSEQIIAVPPC